MPGPPPVAMTFWRGGLWSSLAPPCSEQMRPNSRAPFVPARTVALGDARRAEHHDGRLNPPGAQMLFGLLVFELESAPPGWNRREGNPGPWREAGRRRQPSAPCSNASRENPRELAFSTGIGGRPAPIKGCASPAKSAGPTVKSRNVTSSPARSGVQHIMPTATLSPIASMARRAAVHAPPGIAVLHPQGFAVAGDANLQRRAHRPPASGTATSRNNRRG